MFNEYLEIKQKRAHFCIINFLSLKSFCLRGNIKYLTQCLLT